MITKKKEGPGLLIGKAWLGWQKGGVKCLFWNKGEAEYFRTLGAKIVAVEIREIRD